MKPGIHTTMLDMSKIEPPHPAWVWFLHNRPAPSRWSYLMFWRWPRILRWRGLRKRLLARMLDAYTCGYDGQRKLGAYEVENNIDLIRDFADEEGGFDFVAPTKCEMPGCWVMPTTFAKNEKFTGFICPRHEWQLQRGIVA